MAVNVGLTRVQAYSNQNSKNSVKGNGSVDVYMYYHVRGLKEIIKALN